MKFFFDRNWSPYLAAAIGELCRPLGHDVKYLDDLFPRTCPDIDWINELGRQGGWVVITRDRLKESPAEREALRRTGILTFIFTKQWNHVTDWDQAWSLVRWWPAVLALSERVRSGAFTVPYRFSGNGKMDQIRL